MPQYLDFPITYLQKEAVVSSTPRVVPGLSCSEQLPREVGGGGRHQKKACIRFVAFPTKPNQASPLSALLVCLLLPGYQDKGLSERWGFSSSARPWLEREGLTVRRAISPAQASPPPPGSSFQHFPWQPLPSPGFPKPQALSQ